MSDPESVNEDGAAASAKPPRKGNGLARIAMLLITALCFAYLYYRLNGAAIREGLTLVEYMAQVFATVNWIPWLLVMVTYSLFYFTIDTLVVTKALNWFVKEIKYKTFCQSAPAPTSFQFLTNK